MQDYIIGIRNRMVVVESDDPTLVRTSSGIDRIRVRIYDAEWLDFDSSLALAIGGTVYEQALDFEEAEAEWVAEAVVPVPDAALDTAGVMSVAVHGVDGSNRHIITVYAAPLTVEMEGDHAN